MASSGRFRHLSEWRSENDRKRPSDLIDSRYYLEVCSHTKLGQVHTQPIAAREAEAGWAVVYGDGCGHGVAELSLVGRLQGERRGKFRSSDLEMEAGCGWAEKRVQGYARLSWTRRLAGRWVTVFWGSYESQRWLAIV